MAVEKSKFVVWTPNITWMLTWLYMGDGGWVKYLNIFGADIVWDLKNQLGEVGQAVLLGDPQYT